MKKLQERIRETYLHYPNAQIVIFGKVGHAEVIGLQGQTNNTAIVVESEADLDKVDKSRPIYLFSQTTKDTQAFEAIARQLPTAIVYNTICRSVANRVGQLQLFAQTHDWIIFVGGAKSSNAKVLFQHCLAANPNSIFISNPDELDGQLPIADSQQLKVGITGATSTPLWLMQQTKDILWNTQSKQSVCSPQEVMHRE